jgi:hypothetical protein
LIAHQKNILINVDLMPDESTIVTNEPLNQVIIHFTVTGSFIVARVWKGCLWWRGRMFKFITHEKGHIIMKIRSLKRKKIGPFLLLIPTTFMH